VQEIFDTGEFETVYNITVSDWHTYFVRTALTGITVWSHNAGTGGCAPVNKGKVGEAMSEAEAIAAGERIRGKQPTFELPSGRRTRPDTLTDTPAGDLKVREAKNGPTARLSEGQAELRDVIATGGTVIPRGRRAAQAGLTPGQPVSVKHFEEDHY
jgi:hypothetical protein